MKRVVVATFAMVASLISFDAKAVELGTVTGPALSQSDIDSHLKATRNG